MARSPEVCGIALGLTLLAATAHADPLPVRHVVAVVDGPTDASLEERMVGPDTMGWIKVCELPCEASMIANPVAEHRILDDGHRYPIHLSAATEGERVVVHYERGSKGGRIAFIGLGSAAAGVGVFMLAFAGLRAISGKGVIGESCNASCGNDYDGGVTAGLAVGGGLLALAGLGGILYGISIGKSTLVVGDGKQGSDEEAPPPERTPSWRASAWTLPSAPWMLPVVSGRF